ncbi:electron transfer flavoprotein subunit beta/FixA family protein [Desulfofustis limnaeus]|jgi:electron transfer flavoprotein beta subunit|uniref:Electron transfer flavoprotein subunit beta n=1 Tax=Desulfofustis limnaeus TaxID=2740163 RepID=A0ABM7WBI4_9BACT|nr:electron transfer flavoprotein subunit beta/FixA family protein [Desulfofustis limnaeus]MDX9896663.1 electron transfer flavoprotein subunit beta/FixA family protein [Desulfofustis sp.]BDD88304.1 electron transfer flavoprotein subunit beta [Desulfofustis limnaeus]
MKILVCIKQVPDMESKFKVAADGRWYDTADLAWRLNEYDEYAVEQAVLVKEQGGDTDITVLSIGPDKVKEAIKKALAMGCDRGVQVVDNEVSQREPLEIAGIISRFAKDKGFDLILTGMQSQDRGSAQVGILVAEMLDMAGVSTVVGFSLAGAKLELKRELEGGVKARVAVTLPAVVTCQLGLNTPRYPTLPNIMKAKKKELLSLPVSDLLQAEPRQQTAKVYFPEKKGGGLILEGEPAELADRLIQIIKEKTAVLA